MKLNTLQLSVITIVAFTLLTGCGRSAEQKEAEQRALDADRTVVSSCTFDTVYPIEVFAMSGEETAAVCEKMARAMGRNPSVRLLRHLSKAVVNMKIQGRSNDIVGNACQFMRIAEGRGQLDNDDAMYATFDVVFRIVNGTEGRVMPKDLNIFLSSMGEGAKKLSDDGLIRSASLVSAMKQNQGG